MRRTTVLLAIALLALGGSVAMASGATESGTTGPVKLTMWADAFEKSFPAGVQDDPVAKELERLTGVALDITPMNAVGNYNDKLAAALASNDLPDIAIINDATILPKIVSSRAALALDPYLEKYAPNYTKVTPQRITYARDILGRDIDGKTDGKVYFLTLRGDYFLDPLQAQVAPYLRYDLWAKLGYPKVESMDDYITVLQNMMKLEPQNKDGKNVYGASAWFADAPGWNDWVFNAVWGMFEGVSAVGEHIMMDIEKYAPYSKILNADSPYWHGVEWFNKAYRAGVLDPDCFIMKWDNFLEKAAGNRVLLGWAPWMMDGGNTAFAKDGSPERGYVQMPCPTKGNRYMLSFDNPLGGTIYMVSKKTTQPEKAVQFMDFLNSYDGAELLFNGVKGTHWDVQNGRPVVTPEVLKGLAEGTDFRITSGVYKYHNLAGRGGSAVDPNLKLPVYFMYLPEYVATRLSPLQKLATAHFGITLPSDLYTKNPNLKFTNADNTITVGMPDKPDAIKTIDTKLNNYIQANEFKLIMADSPGAFDAAKKTFIEDCRKIGAEQSLTWFSGEFAKLLKSKGR